MFSMAKKLLVCTTLVAMLLASGPALAGRPDSSTRAKGLSAYVMMVLESFFGPEIGLHISEMARNWHRWGPVTPEPDGPPSGDPGPTPEEPIP